MVRVPPPQPDYEGYLNFEVTFFVFRKYKICHVIRYWHQEKSLWEENRNEKNYKKFLRVFCIGNDAWMSYLLRFENISIE